MQPELAPTDAAPPASFGAKDVFDLSWKNLMDAYSCTECGRCTSACPANITGKQLSPRSIMMKTRDRLEEVGKNINANKSFTADNKSLLHDYITVEELRACTTCNACVEACPVSISPLEATAHKNGTVCLAILKTILLPGNLALMKEINGLKITRLNLKIKGTT